jgi:eukaryotic-like serine/threonine-protein kinase
MERSAEHDERVMTIVAAALRMPVAERESFLHIACQDDAELCHEAEKVVEWEERMGNFLREPLINFIDLGDLDRPFEAGDLISERFEIMREVGRGGMGVVYEAFDRKRNQRIAIKSALPGFGRLLSPELEGALKVRHPNICLVNEIHTAPTASGEVDFLTMEFLDGATLSARITAQESLSSKEILEIARQLCAGLAEAHRSGIIHRDLKAANVILARDKDASMRAVITDFGLARDATLDCEDFAGTPRYIEPELWRGEKASKASDIYALGVILYELVTGQPPYEGSSNNEAATSQPIVPSVRNSGLDVRWNKAILPCFAPSPTARPDATQVLAVFDKRPILKSPVLAMAVVAMIALVTGLYRPVRELLKPADIRLAILPVQAPTDLTEMGNGVLQDVVERISRTQRARTSLAVIPPAESLRNNVRSPVEAQTALHASHVLQVKLRRQGDQLAVEAFVIDVTNGAHVRDFSSRYSSDALGDLPSALTGVVSLALGLHGSSAPDTISPAATVPYMKALYLLRRDENSFDEAIPLFEDAARIDGHSPLPLAGLAEAKLMKFRSTPDPKWRDAANQAVRAGEALNPDSVTILLAEGRLEGSRGYYEKALEAYRRVAEIEPRNVEALLRIAAVYEHQNLRNETIESYRKAIQLDPGFYKPYQNLGRFFLFRGQSLEAAEQFQNAIERAPGVYDIYTDLGAAKGYLGRDDEAEKAFLASLKIKENSRALDSLGVLKAYQRRDTEAVEYYTRSLKLDPNSYVCLLNLADATRRSHPSSETHSLYFRGMELAAAELRANPRSGYTRAMVGYFAAGLGERRRAEDEIEQALHLSPTDNQVIRLAVLAYELLRERDRALAAAALATPEVLHELDRHPDLAVFRQDSRFKELIAKSAQ